MFLKNAFRMAQLCSYRNTKPLIILLHHINNLCCHFIILLTFIFHFRNRIEKNSIVPTYLIGFFKKKRRSGIKI